MKSNSLPTAYNPAKSIIIGTNKFENVDIFISFNGHIPILIGDGEKPHIWINIPMNKEGTDWYPLVKDNFSTNPNVVIYDKGSKINISTPDGVILDCEKNIEGTINVKNLDLRPFGLNIQADNEKLVVMNKIFTTNAFINSSIVFNINGT